MEKQLAISEEGIQILVKNCQGGDKESFEPIYNLYIEKIFRYILFRIGGDREEAKDLSSEIFVEAYLSLSQYQFRKGTKFSSWLYSIARHILGDYYRKQKRSLEIPASDELWNFIPDTKISELKQLIGEEESKKALKNIEKLPKIQREALTLRFFEDMDYREISKVLGKTEGNIRIIIHRGIKNLKKLLEHESH